MRLGNILPRTRIARSLTTVIALSFLQVIAAPVFIPVINTPQAQASTLYESRSNFLQWTSWQGTNANHIPYKTSAGTAEITSNGDAINLTQNQNSQRGFLWNTQSKNFDSSDLVVSANYYFGSNNGGADGITFSMRPLANWPNGGTSSGNGTSGDVFAAPEIRVYFDTFQNDGERSEDHLTLQAIKSNGTTTTYTSTGILLKNASGNEVTDVETDAQFPFTIKWIAATRTLTVYSGLNADYQIISQVIPITEMDATSFAWGWSGYTGGANNYQAISSVNYQTSPTTSTTSTDTSVLENTTVNLSATYTSSEASPTTRWEYSTDGGSSWSSTGVTTTNYTFTATRAMTNRKFRFYVESTVNSVTFSRTTNPITLTVAPPPLGAETDTAITLNGNSQYLSFADNATYEIGNAISFEAWVFPTEKPAANSWSLVLEKPASYELGMISYADRTYWAFWFQGTGTSSMLGESTTVSVQLNEWHHIAVTRAANSSTVLFYYDGKLAYTGTKSTPGTGALYDSSFPFVIGARYSNGSPPTYGAYFKGQIDHVAVFDVARSATDIANDMYNYIDTKTVNLKMYYDFNEGTGTTIYNRVSGASASSDLTAVGSPSFTDIKTVTTEDPYTVVKFPRTYLTSLGGWKYSGVANRATALIVGGGGGGGAGYQGGGGGAGGFQELNVNVATSTTYPIKVGAGGIGGVNSLVNPVAPTGGDTSTAFNISSVGGGRGSTEWDIWNGSSWQNTTYPATNGGSGGGGSWGTNNSSGGTGISGQGFAGGNGGGSNPDLQFAGSGGGGAGSAGSSPSNTYQIGGAGGAGKLSIILNSRIAGGGGGGSRRAGGDSSRTGIAVDGGGSSGWATSRWPMESGGASNGTTNTGGGGGGSASELGNAAGYSGYGGSGIVAIRWITRASPAYTKPINITLDVGQYETFTTNVEQDSATVGLTRTFKWESTTAGANGNYSLIKQGTGAINAVFSWLPSDTSTSGSNYLYRLTVIDSDTAGLFIEDSSTAYATINKAMVYSGKSGLSKTVNLGKSETFTISLGTGPYQVSSLGTEPSLRIETLTSSSFVLKVSDTASIGTYYETITVIDSVSAIMLIPVVVNVVPAPTFLNSGALVNSGIVLDYQPGNSQSLLGVDGQATTGLTLRDLSGRKNDATTDITSGAGWSGTSSCAAPKYSSNNGGAITIESNKCYYTTYTAEELRNNYTVELWVKLTSTLSIRNYILSQLQQGSSTSSNIIVGSMGADDYLDIGFIDDNYSIIRTTGCEQVPGAVGTPIAPAADGLLNKWIHVAGTYDGLDFKLYLNGQLKCTRSYTSNFTLTSSYAGIAIGTGSDGRGLSGFSGSSFSGSLSSIRMYKTALSGSDISANYSATKDRFDTSNNYLVNISKKYGSLAQESFTVTSGTETNTVSYAIGSRTGILLDTSTASIIKLSLQESSTVGTYYETLTVTDGNGSSTILPLKLNVSQADTLTVTIDTATVATYNGSPLITYPKVKIKGLQWSDTATVSASFTSSIYPESTIIPTNADTYTVKGANLNFTLGSQNNYVNVVYETSTAVINKAKQNPLNIFMYGGTVGLPYLIWPQGGNGDGAVTESLTGVSNIPGCAINNHILTSTTTQQGFCEVKVTKAASQNYLSESATVQLYFMAYVNNQPTNQVGSGPTIGINGRTSLTIDDSSTVTAPNILTWSLSGNQLTINGVGFGSTQVVVEFFMYLDVNVTPTLGGTQIVVTVPVGAITGPVSVIKNPGGIDSIPELVLP